MKSEPSRVETEGADLPHDLLQRDRGEAARRLALALLTPVETAAERLASPGDSEALHDLRVAVRRLRSLLRAFAECLDGDVPRRVEKSLRRVARSTNRGRDAEVQAIWLRELARPDADESEEGPPLAAPARRTALRLAGKLDEVRRREDDRAIGPAREAALAVVPILRRRLGSYRTVVDLSMGGAREEQRPFSAQAARLLEQQHDVLREALGLVLSLKDVEPAHRARIEAKRLRYLLETLRAFLPEARQPVSLLRDLQDLLGELNDLAVLEGTIEEAMAQGAAERARRIAAAAREEGATSPAVRRARAGRSLEGLPELAEATRGQAEARFERLRDGWLEDGPCAAELSSAILTSVAALHATD